MYVNLQHFQRALLLADNMFLCRKVFPSKDTGCFRFKPRCTKSFLEDNNYATAVTHLLIHHVLQNRTESGCDTLCEVVLSRQAQSCFRK
jgi:hypothetical protein